MSLLDRDQLEIFADAVLRHRGTRMRMFPSGAANRVEPSRLPVQLPQRGASGFVIPPRYLLAPCIRAALAKHNHEHNFE
jgi:hypothetical protein